MATNDLHYTQREDAKPHDVLLCIQQQKLQSDTNRLRFDSDEFYLKTAEEMREVFRELPEACDATLQIAEMCELGLVYGSSAPPDERFHVPRFEPPQGKDRDAYLRELVMQGAQERYGTLTPPILERIEQELGVIISMGFSGYFLIVWDLIRFARENGIRVGPGRGSAAGSVVSYSLRITDLDPLRYDLIFERFLNPGRIQMPDIDMDFDERRRDEVIRYVASKYGSDRVAQIITFQTIKGKQGIRDAARVLGFPASVGDRLCKMYPPAIMGRDEPIEKALQLSPELRDAYEREPEAREIVDTARALEGLRREDSVHAAGVVIGDAPLVNYLPLKLSKDSRDDSRRIVTQFDMHGVEKLGLLKMDFLGLRTLSVIEDTLSHLRRRDIELDIDHVPLDDAGRVRDALPGRHDRRVPAGGRRDALADQAARARPVRGPDGPRGAVPARAAERRDARRVRRAQARAAAGVVPARGPRGDPSRHVRDHGLPGAGDADRRAHGRATRWPRPTCSARRWARRSAPS